MKQGLEKIAGLLKKYKYVVLVLLLGILLLLIPGKKEAPRIVEEAILDDSTYERYMEQELGGMLSKIEGAGRVEVMLTMQYGSHTEFQMDTQISTEADRSSEERKTVILSEGSAYDKAAVSVVRYPQFQGALVLCEGAEQPKVKLDILNAVSALTGLGTDRITVVKMN